MGLTNVTYERFKDNIILYYTDDCKGCVKAIDEFEKAQLESPANFYTVNCGAWPDLCKDRVLPALSATYMNVSYTMVDNYDNAKQMSDFVSAMLSPILKPHPNQESFQEKMEQQNWKVYFVFYGPDHEELEKEVLQMKGKIAATYIYSPTKKVICYRYGVEIVFNEVFDSEHLVHFIQVNMFPIFGKITAANLQNVEHFKLGIMVFNPKNEQHKQFAKKFQQFYSKHLKDQDRIGKQCVFIHINTLNKEFQNIIKLVGVNEENDFSFTIAFRDSIKRYETSKDVEFNERDLEQFIDGILTGDIKMNKVQQQQQQKPTKAKFDEEDEL